MSEPTNSTEREKPPQDLDKPFPGTAIAFMPDDAGVDTLPESES